MRTRREPTTQVVVGIDASLSRDGGRTWSTTPTTGIAFSVATVVSALLSSADGAYWYVQTQDAGLYRSADSVSWTAVDPMAAQPSTFRSLTALKVALPALGRQSVLVYANPFRSATNPGSALLSPPTHVPAFTASDQVVQLIGADEGEDPYSGVILAVMTRASADGQEGHAVVSRCDSTFVCDSPNPAVFPQFHVPEDSYVPLDFAKAGRLFVWVRDIRTNVLSAYQTTDGGAHFSPMPGLNQALRQITSSTLPKGARREVLGLAVSPKTPATIFARIHLEMGQDPTFPEQIWRSTDNGVRWTRIGQSQVGPEFTRVGSLPWTSTLFGPAHLKGNITVTRDGRLLVVGIDPKSSRQTVWCSINGEKWSDRC